MDTNDTEQRIVAAALLLARGVHARDILENLQDSGYTTEEAVLILAAAKILQKDNDQ